MTIWGKINDTESCKFLDILSGMTDSNRPLFYTNRPGLCQTQILCWQGQSIQTHTNTYALLLTTDFDVAVLPWRVWVCGKAPGSVTSIRVPTVVIM